VTVALASRDLGGAGEPALVVLHGLLGSSRNWQSAGAALAARGPRVLALDLRNHGESPWDEDCGFGAMADDVRAWLRASGLGPAHLVGHSLGGKVAMRLAAEEPGLVARLTVVDIAPRDYPGRLRVEFEAMRRLDLAGLGSRRDADQALADLVTDWALRQFILTNLGQDADGRWAWKVNRPALERALPMLTSDSLLPGQGYDGPCRVIRGGRSDYVRDADIPAFRARFPALDVVTLPESGHNPHFDARSGFVEAVLS
jgi:esterase